MQKRNNIIDIYGTPHCNNTNNSTVKFELKLWFVHNNYLTLAQKNEHISI